MKITQIRHFENLHVFFWLVKDSCWMMEWKLAATIMFCFTFGMSALLCYRTRHMITHLLTNAAVFCWICANSSWMFGEFFHFRFVMPALFFFIAGLVLMAFYLHLILVKKRN